MRFRNAAKWGKLLSPVVVLVGCSFSQPAIVAPWCPPPASTWNRPLTIEHTVKLALASDVNASEWHAREVAARAELITAKTLPNPVLDRTLEDIGLKDSAGRSLLLKETDITYSFSKLITRSREIAAAQAGIRKTSQGIDESRRELAKAVGESFYKVLGEQELVKVAEKDVSAAQEMQTAAQKRAEVGEGSGFEVERATAELLAAQRDLDLAKRTLAIDQLILAFQLGSDRPAYPCLCDSWPGNPAPASPEIKVSEAEICRALSRRSDYAEARAAREQAEQQLGVEKRRGLLPGDPSILGGRRDTPDGMSWIATLTLPLPIFDRNQGGITKAQADLATACAAEERIRREVISDLATARSHGALATSQSTEFAIPLVASREKIFSQANELFQAGEITYIDLSTSYRELLSARRAAVEAQRDAAIAGWQIKIASGSNRALWATPDPCETAVVCKPTTSTPTRSKDT